MSKYRPGSRVDQVYNYYLLHGPDKAAEFGKTLDLADGTLRGWIRMWTKAGAEPKIKGIVTPVESGGGAYLFGDPTIQCKVLNKGSEQSEVKFPNGNVRFVSNDWLTIPK